MENHDMLYSLFGFTVILFVFLFSMIILLLIKISELKNMLQRMEAFFFSRPSTPPQPPQQIINTPQSAVPPPQTSKILSAIPVHPSSQSVPAPEKSADTLPVGILKKCWNWLCVGEEFRPQNLAPEYAVATTWLIRGGVVLLLLGGIFLLKYSFEHQYLSPALKVSGITLLGIIAAITGSLRANGKFRAFFLGISGGGFALIYAGIFAAVRLYDFFPAVWGLVAVIPVTALAVWSACKNDGAIIALTGCFGGYLAPVILSSDSGNLLYFFLWLSLFNAGILTAAYLKRWFIVKTAVFILYGILATAGNFKGGTPGTWSLCGLLALFVFNWIILTIPALLNKEKENIFDYIFAAAAWIIFLLLAMPRAEEFPIWDKMPALVLLFSAIVNAIFRQIKSHTRSAELFSILMAASLIMAAGQAFDGVWRPALWSFMALALAFEARRAKSGVLMICAVFLLAITFFAIPESSHAGEYLPELFDNLLCYGLHGIMILAVAEISRRSQNGVGEPLFKSLPLILYIFGGIYLFVYATLETGNALEKYLPGFELGGISLLWGIAGLSTLVFGIRKNIPALRKTGILLFALSCIKVLLLDMAKVPMFWKIVCCSSVGLLLLIAAVIYIRQKDRFQNGN